MRRVVSFLRSVTSGEAPADVVAARRASCDSCRGKVRDEQGREFCGVCGCPRNAASELGRKLRFAHLECPLRRPGFSNSTQGA